MPYTKGATNTSGSPYSLGGPASHQQANNWETQYDEATKSYPKDLLTPFVQSGMVATKNGVTATQLDVTAGVAMVRQTDNTLRTWTPTSSSQSTSGHPSTTMWLFLNPDGTFAWQTSSTPPTNALGIAHCTTDASSNILVVTDDRVTITNILSGAASPPNLPTNATAGGSKIWTQANDGSGSGLDADLLDGHDSSFFQPAGPTTQVDTTNANSNTPQVRASTNAGLTTQDATYNGIKYVGLMPTEGDGVARGTALGHVDAAGAYHALIGTDAGAGLRFLGAGLTGAIYRPASYFSGGGSGTFNHGLPGTPQYVGVMDNTGGTQTMSVSSIGSSTCVVNAFGGHSWLGVAMG